MGLFNKLRWLPSWRRRSHFQASEATGTSRMRICRIEPLEARQYLSASVNPINVGVVYYDQHSNDPTIGSLFYISWNGGAPGTQLSSITIDTDRIAISGNSYTSNPIFHTQQTNNASQFGYVKPAVVPSLGVNTSNVGATITAPDGGTSMTVDCKDFQTTSTGAMLVLNVTVNDAQGGGELDAECVGTEFAGSTFTATFTNSQYTTVTASGTFAPSFDFSTLGLSPPLPTEDYTTPPAPSQHVYTAGASATAKLQVPLPITIAGTVYNDNSSLDTTFQKNWPPVSGVQLALYEQDANGNYVATGQTTTTDTNGNYQFTTGVLPGTYSVVETSANGVVTTATGDKYFTWNAYGGQDNGSDDAKVVSSTDLNAITVQGGDNSVKNDFALVKPITIAGTIYNDNTTLDKAFQSGWPTVSGVGLTLYEQDASGNYVATSQTATTDGNGNYHFTAGVLPGIYEVVETATNGTVTTATGDNYFTWNAYAGQDNGSSVDGNVTSSTDLAAITVHSGDNSTDNNFALVKPITIAGTVYEDNTNLDKQFDSTWPVVGGVQLALYEQDASGNSVATGQTRATDGNGNYSFGNLAPGVYEVVETATNGTVTTPAGNYFTWNAYAGKDNGADDANVVSSTDLNAITVHSGDNSVQNDFALVQPVTLSGYVYYDANNNGIYPSAGDKGLPTAIVQVQDVSTPGVAPVDATTNADGHWTLSGLLPGQYTLSAESVTGYAPGLATAGTVNGTYVGTAVNPGETINSVKLLSDQAGQNYNFGELLASISGIVFVDQANTGQYAVGDKLLSGVTVNLLDSHGVQIPGETTKTDDNGAYSFTGLQPGTYDVQEIQPTQYPYYPSGSIVGSAGGQIDGYNLLINTPLTAGLSATGYDFYEQPGATISGYVFQDGPTIVLQPGQAMPDITTIRTGVINSSDPTIQGVTMILGDGDGNPMTDANGKQITTVTDSNGYYQFTNLEPSQSYTVLAESPPAPASGSYIEGIATTGSNGGLVVNKYSMPPISIVNTLAVSPQKDDAIVHIFVESGNTATSYNFSEVLVQTASPLQGGPSISPPATPQLSPPQAPAVGSPLPPSPLYASSLLSHAAYMEGGGADTPADNTWHLSVVDGGEPRRLQDGSDVADDTASPFFNASTWTGSDLNGGEFILADRDGAAAQHIVFGLAGATPVAGDWNGDGRAKVGVFLDGQWFLDLNGDGKWDDGDLWARLGHEGDQPVTGDWDGDGKTDIGIFGPAWSGDTKALAVERGQPHPENRTVGRTKNIPPDPQEATDGVRVMKKSSRGRIRADVIDHVFRYGGAGDRAVVGDWKGTGVHTIGVFRGGTWYLDVNGDGKFGPGDMVVQFGQAGDIPVVGDWTGDGITKLGVFRNGTFYLDTNNNHQLDASDKVIPLGKAGDRPVVGDFDGGGVDEVGVYRDGGGAANGSQASAPVSVPVQMTSAK